MPPPAPPQAPLPAIVQKAIDDKRDVKVKHWMEEAWRRTEALPSEADQTTAKGRWWAKAWELDPEPDEKRRTEWIAFYDWLGRWHAKVTANVSGLGLRAPWPTPPQSHLVELNASVTHSLQRALLPVSKKLLCGAVVVREEDSYRCRIRFRGRRSRLTFGPIIPRGRTRAQADLVP